MTGFADPFALLSRSGDDWRIAVAIIEQADQMMIERLKWHAEYTASKVAEFVAKAFR